MAGDSPLARRIILVLAAGTILVQSAGCWPPAAFAQTQLPYSLNARYRGLGTDQSTELADIDGDGTDDLIAWDNRKVVATQLEQPRENLVDYSSAPNEFLCVDLVDVYGEDRKLIGIGLAYDGLSICRILYKNRDGDSYWVELDPIDEQCWPLIGGGPDTRSALRPRVLLADHDPPLLLVTIHTGYYPKQVPEGVPNPRGLAAYRWPEGDTLWTRRFGPDPDSYGIRIREPDNTYEIIVGAYAPGNGAEHAGLHDSSSWVLSYDMEGSELWRTRFGSEHCGASILTGKADSDDAPRIFVGVRGPGQEPGENSVCEIDPKTGTRLRSLYLDSSVEDLCWVDGSSGSAGPLILAVTRSIKALLIDTDLAVRKRRSVSASEEGLKLGGRLVIPTGRGGMDAVVLKTSSFVRVYTSDLDRLLAVGAFLRDRPHKAWVFRSNGEPKLLAILDGEDLKIYDFHLKPFLVRQGHRILNRPWLFVVLILVPLAALFMLFRYRGCLAAAKIWIRDSFRAGQSTEHRLPLQADNLFNDALEVPPAQRSAFLTRACKGNAELKVEVESLLEAASGLPRLAGGTPSVSPADLEQIGRYPVLGEIGRGGMGVVYLARDPALDRTIAIKVLPDRVADDPRSARMFEREARLAASVSHANVATVFSFEEDKGLRFITMEYVPGQTLAERLDAGPMSMWGALHTCHEIAAAMEAAHLVGVIHRDLKPANVKLLGDGKVKVLDFGIAKSILVGSTDAQLPKSSGPPSSAFLGTPGYMSPEQMLAGKVDHRTDIWALGCVLYECLSGDPAFGKRVLDAGILARDPDWRKLHPQTPKSIRRLLRGCLQKETERRETSMAVVRRELEKALAEIGR